MRIKLWRVERGLTQTEMAKKMRVTQAQISYLERGAILTKKMAKKLERVMGEL